MTRPSRPWTKSGTELTEAIGYATNLHLSQVDKGGQPYTGHVLRVMGLVAAFGNDEELLIAAVLHDTVEDTPATLDDVEERFGPRIRELVDFLTRKKDETYAQYIDRIATNPDAARIKIADLVDNMDTRRAGYTPSLQKRYIKALDRLIASL